MRILGPDIILSTTDLTKYVRCPHASYLDRASATGELSPRAVPPSAMSNLIAEKGDAHESAFVDDLRARGHEVVTVETSPWTKDGLLGGEAATLDAMKRGAEYIYHAGFFDGKRAGYADFLERVDHPSLLGEWSYEVLDTKLSRSVRPHFLLQLADYSDHVTRLQGVVPQQMHVILGTRERASFRVDEFDAYHRHVRSSLDGMLLSGVVPESYRVELCDLCVWRSHCWNEWNDADHLSLVANIRRGQVTRLRQGGIATLTALAESAPAVRIRKIAAESFAALAHQARLQWNARRTGTQSYDLLPLEKERGFARLPKSSENDIFLDFEGDPFLGDGLTFLFGRVSAKDGVTTYTPSWVNDEREEKQAFEHLVDELTECLSRDADAHFYHYGATETATLKRLAGRYGTREDALDDLLRAEAFVDLAAVVRQALRISQPSYGLKKLETYYAFEREEREVLAGGGAVVAYEQWLDSGDDGLRRALQKYNAEDCASLAGLQQWLGRIKPQEVPWRERTTPREQTQSRLEEHQRKNALYQALIGEDALLAHLLYYHWREERPGWWRYFDRTKMDVEELLDDTECIGGLRRATEIPARDEKKSRVLAYSYPGQEHKFDRGDFPHDPATQKSAGEVVSIDDGTRIVGIKRGPKLLEQRDPAALMPAGPVNSAPVRAALERFAASIAEGGYDATPYRAGVDVLLSRPPRITAALSDVVESCRALDRSYLFVQGPPGAGKTRNAALAIVRLLRDGKRIAVTSNSHKAIHNLLHEIEEIARASNYWFRGLKKCSDDANKFDSRLTNPMIESTKDNAPCTDRSVPLIAGTAWLFSEPELDQAFDYIFIDEAGQVPLANALAVSTVARNMVLLGDPLQLAQVSQGSHPDGAGESVLQHLLGKEATVQQGRGIFLGKTWRMHPDVCAFVSKMVYESRLHSAEECARQAVTVDGRNETGLRFMAVEHEGNSQSSDEEATRIAREIRRILAGTFTDSKGVTKKLRESDFLVVAAYNAQVRHITAALNAAGLKDVPVGTVDKFQGRQAPIVFFSMATSSGAELPRDIDFLFSKNRLNVAVSRARCLAIVVASPRLLDVECKTVAQMKLANGLCRFVEMAERW